MKKFKKTLSLILAIIMIATTIPFAFAADGAKLTINMTDSYGDGWNDAGIAIYKNGVPLETTVFESGETATWEADYDSTATYTFYWVEGNYDSECSFEILADGESAFSADTTACDGYADGALIFTLESGCEHQYDDYGYCSLCGKCDVVLAEMSSQIRFNRNADGSYAETFDVRTRVQIGDEDFTKYIGATNSTASQNIKKVGFVYSINPDTFSIDDAKTVAKGGEVSGYTDATVKYIQDADGYYMFTCLVTDIPMAEKDRILVSFAYICVENAEGTETWYFMNYQAEADFNALYSEWYVTAGIQYGWFGNQEQLQTLLDAGGEVTLDKDYYTESSVMINSGVIVTLNLNGKTVSCDDIYPLINNGTLTVNGDGTVINTDGIASAIYNNGTLTINGGTFTGSYGVYNNNGTLIINNAPTFNTTFADVYWYGGAIDLSGFTGDEITIEPDSDGMALSDITLPEGAAIFDSEGNELTADSTTTRWSVITVRTGV